jgi:hypothetical protein
MKPVKPIDLKNIDQFIQEELDKLLKTGKKPKQKESYLDKYKIKLKKKNLPTALKKTTLKEKFGKKKKVAFGPANAGGMDSSLSGDAGVAPTDGGFGVGGYAVRGFGEAINKNAKAFINFVNRLKSENTDVNLIKTLTDGYKAIFSNIEDKSSAIICGFQPSLRDYMNFKMEDFVFAINNYSGEIVVVYIGEANKMEPVEIIKKWYKDIGIDEDVINKILFIEKANGEVEESMLDIPFSTGKGDLVITSDEDIDIITEHMTNPIFIGCSDLFFLPEFMMSIAKQGKKFEIDKNFMFLL